MDYFGPWTTTDFFGLAGSLAAIPTRISFLERASGEWLLIKVGDDDFRDKFLYLIRAASERPMPKVKVNPQLSEVENELALTKDQIGRALDVLVRVSSPEMEGKLRNLEAKKAELEERLEELAHEDQAQSALTPLREIDCGDNDALASNIRATVRKIVIDIAARSFSVMLFDGRQYSYEEKEGQVKLTVPEGESPLGV